MIRLECSNCKTVLNIDDAFAGGVCRCQYCGTIQTVPKKGAANQDSPSDNGQPTQKELFKRKARIESALSPYNDQLDRVADELESSGNFSSSALAGLSSTRTPSSPSSGDSGVSPAVQQGTARKAIATATQKVGTVQAPSDVVPSSPALSYTPKPSAATAPKPATAQSANKKPLFIGISAAAVVVVAAGIWFATRTGGHQSATASQPSASPADAAIPHPVAPAPQVPSISGIRLHSPTVVYIVDRAGCSQELYQKLLNSCSKSINSLAPSQSFQVIVWNSSSDQAYPALGPELANDVRAEAARRTLADATPGSSDIASILTRALTGHSQEIVLLSTNDLDDQSAMQIRKTLGGKTATLHGIAVGTQLTGDRLRGLVSVANGQFQKLDPSQLD